MTSTIELTLRHAQFLSRHLKSCGVQCATVAILLELGMSTKNVGFDYLRKAIIMFYSNPTQSITKNIYPDVGERYDPKVGSQTVEIAIRRVIDSAWQARNEKIWSYYFFPDRDGEIARPTNGEFISKIAYFLELVQGCSEEGSNEGT